MWQTSYDDSSSLYLVPTPIGNMEDMSVRSINVLKMVDVIFSEDTRVTSQLLSYFKISKKLIALHDHNEDDVKEKVLSYLSLGKNVALVTDRGTPIISDPGYKTVSYVSKLGYNVVALPGPCAFVPALIVSGLPPQPFMFYGFLNSKDTKRKKELEGLKDCRMTMIFYEAPHRIEKTLELMLEVFGDRNVSLSREITKKFESVFRGKLSECLNDRSQIRGEFVIVVEGNNTVEDYSDMDIVSNVDIYISNGMAIMDAIKRVAKERGLKKNDVYKEYHTRRME